MVRQQKIQAAIDALPYATGGEWRPRLINYGTTKDLWCIDWSDDQEEVAEYVYGSANATHTAAAKDLAEEVARLRGLLDEAFRSGELVHQLPRTAAQNQAAGMYEIGKMPEGKFVVGGLELCKQVEDSIWIQDTTSQEGFETPVVDLERTLRGFWQANI